MKKRRLSQIRENRLSQIKVATSVLISLLLICAHLCIIRFTSADETQFVYDSKHRRDPFSPLVTSSGEMLSDAPTTLASENISLEGIIWDPKGDSIAMINGTIVKEGDIIDDITIKKISDNYVVVLVQDEERVIPLVKEEGGKDAKESEGDGE